MKVWKVYKIILGIMLFLSIERFCRFQTGGFRVSKVCVEYDYGFSEASSEIPSEMRVLLDQPYTFLGRGVQFFAFLGEDQKTVLKLFKHHHTGIPIDFIEKWFPSFLRDPLIEKRKRRMQRLFKSAYIAKTKLAQETGVFFCHLAKNKSDSFPIILKDKLGSPFPLDLGITEFVVQKKAIDAEKTLDTLLQKKQVDEAILAMQKLLVLIEERSQKGIKNKDGKILENYGFIENEPIEMDIGSYIYRNHSTCPNPHRNASQKAKKQLLHWVQKHHLTFYDQIQQALNS